MTSRPRREAGLAPALCQLGRSWPLTLTRKPSRSSTLLARRSSRAIFTIITDALTRPPRLEWEPSFGQLPLQYLSRRGAWQLIDERDVARNREAAQPVSDITLDHLFVQRCPVGPDHEGREALTELRIGNADHCHVSDLRQRGDSFFDRPREYILSAG